MNVISNSTYISAVRLGRVITPGLATRLRVLLEQMDDDVALALSDLGLRDYRPRFSAVIRHIDTYGPVTIGDVAERLGVTHSAASQTVSEMERRGLLIVKQGEDARHRLVRLSPKSKRLLPAINAEWDATDAAAEALDTELPYRLSQLVDDLEAALARRRFRYRIADAAHALPDSEHRTVLISTDE